jgi:hypothetical protein
MKRPSIMHVFWLVCCAASAQSFTNSGISGPNVNTGYTIRGGATTITQSTDTATITPANSVACPADNDNYYRRFDLDGAHGITTAFNISSVDFGVETTTGNAGSQNIVVNLYSIPNASALTLANLTLVGSANISVADGAGFIQNAVVAGVVDGSTSDLVVEVIANDTTNATAFFIGSNANGQSAPSFILSAGCGATEPTDIGSLGFPNMHILMVVNGTVGGGGVPAAPARDLPVSGLWALIVLALGVVVVSRRKFAKS